MVVVDGGDQSAGGGCVMTKAGAGTSVMAETFTVGGLANGDGAESSSRDEITEKDPRKIARK